MLSAFLNSMIKIVSLKNNHYITMISKGLPWIFVVIIFTLLFRRYSMTDVLLASRYVHWSYFIFYALGYFLYIFIFDCWTFAWVFSRFKYATRFQEMVPIRLASYLLMIFNYAAGQAMLAYFFKKSKGVPFFKSSSLIFFTVLIDLYWTISFAFVGSSFVSIEIEGLDVSRLISLIWCGATVGFCALIIFFKLPIQWKALKWVKSRDLFHTFHHARLKDYGWLLVMRLPMHVAINTLYFIFIPIYKNSRHIDVILF